MVELIWDLGCINAGRYYLVDSGYAEKEGFMVPFQGQRLHLEHFEGVRIDSLCKEDKFNWCHVSLRNIIEGGSEP
jgi:hypothetical protein